MPEPATVRFDPAPSLRGTIVAPPDKSISHRAALLGAMTAEPVRVRNALDAADTRSTLDALRTLGAIVERRGSELIVRGPGLRDVAEPGAPIDVGNAGTLMRLLPGWLAAQDGRAFTLDGDASIRRRPVDRVAAPLRAMGARIEAREDRFPPFTVHGAKLSGIAYDSPVASAQVKSCVLLAALTATGETTVAEPSVSRDHTERMLLRARVSIAREGSAVRLAPTDELELEDVTVPGDLSSAAFLVAAGVIVPGSRLVVRNVGVNWTRTGFLRILERMGAVVVGDLEPAGAALTPDEPVTELDVRSGPLVGTVVDADEVPLAIDELPLVALLGCFAEGETVVRGAAELRVKESDRIATVVDGLRALGAEIDATDDGFAVWGTGGLRGGRIDSHGDHRIAMMGAIAGLASTDGVEVADMGAAGVSYPRFAEQVAALT